MPPYRGPRGSGFVGLQQYLNANQGAAQQMGNQLAQQVEQQGSGVRGEIDAASAAFDSRALAGTPQFNTGYGLEPDEQALLNQQGANAAYTGPKELREVANVDQLGTRALEAQQNAQMLGSEAGRAVLLRRNMAPGTHYSQGNAMLDSFLAGRGAGDRIAAAGSAYGRLKDYLGGAETRATARAQQGAKDAADVRARYAALPAPTYAQPGGPAPAPRAPPRDPRQGAPPRVDVPWPNRDSRDPRRTPGRTPYTAPRYP